MKKFFSLVAALAFAFAANATDYYFAGAANGWSNNTTKFEQVEGVLTVAFDNFSGEFKITTGSWHPQWGAQQQGDKIKLGEPYVLAKCNDTEEQPEADVPNLGVELAEGKHYENAKLTLTEEGDNLVVTLVAGTLVDNAPEPEWYLTGESVGWNEKAKGFELVEGVLTVEVEDFYGEFKVTKGSWHPQWGAQQAGDKIKLGEPYVLAKCNDTEEQPEADVPNLGVELEENYRYKNAKLTLTIGESEEVTITLVAGTLYDHSEVPATYQLVGACTNNWSTTDAIQFEPVEGVLTAVVPDLNGTFKIIQDRGWANQWATNWETGAGLELGEPYTLGAKDGNNEPKNLSLANPFGGYKNAVLTLEVGETMVLTLVSGEFYKTEADWFIPGTWNGWKCDETAKFTAVEGKENTYEFLVAEFGGDFKVVYGNWAVEFGQNAEGDVWEVGKSYLMTYPAAGNGNLHNADDAARFVDVTITIEVDYEKAEVNLLITSEGTGVENLVNSELKAYKTIENGQIVIYKNNKKYNVLGAEL